MKTYRLLFSAPMARAVVAGTKTQTRRMDRRLLNAKPGDLLLGKETWKTDVSLDQVPPSAMDPGSTQVLYLADGAVGGIAWDNMQPGKTRVSIHMPDWACRIRARIVSVREEFLTSITDADARAEGAEDYWCGTPKHSHVGCCGPGAGFRRIWTGIHTEPGTRWEDGPKVVRVEFAPEVNHG